MVIDSSALLAILLDEPERRRFIEIIEADPVRLLSAANLVETSIVLFVRSGDAAIRELNLFLRRAGVEVQPVDAELAELAIDAFRHFGKGVHAAGLNYGDCFAYALAKATGEPLLFKGNDFTRTDISRC